MTFPPLFLRYRGGYGASSLFDFITSKGCYFSPSRFNVVASATRRFLVATQKRPICEWNVWEVSIWMSPSCTAVSHLHCAFILTVSIKKDRACKWGETERLESDGKTSQQPTDKTLIMLNGYSLSLWSVFGWKMSKWNEVLMLDNGRGKNNILILYSQVFHLSSYKSEHKPFVSADVLSLRSVAVFLEGSFT